MSQQKASLNALNTKFQNPLITQTGEKRAFVDLIELKTLWFNTGTLCNLSCKDCYIKSSPTNDSLSYLTLAEFSRFIKEALALKLHTQQIGLTGGEPFMNPQLVPMIKMALNEGFEVLVLTNAMRPMMKCQGLLLEIPKEKRNKLIIRVSLDHYTPHLHEQQRGVNSFQPTIKGLQWLTKHQFNIHIAAQQLSSETAHSIKHGLAKLCNDKNIKLQTNHPEHLVVFPQMNEASDVSEITTKCWSILKKNPHDMMCAKSRMVIKRKHQPLAEVVSCTLLVEDEAFILGTSLKQSQKRVFLNHPFCAQFCVLGGASCS